MTTIDAKPRYQKRGPAWVCKTDIMRYRRCRYAFWLLDTGQVQLEAIITPIARDAINRGNQFEATVFDSAAPLPEAMPLEKAFSGKHQIFDLPLFENPALEIFGVPDGVDTAAGQLFPIEIKGRAWSVPSDRIELAFYWLLLEPYRKKKPTAPKGKVILQSERGRPKIETLDLEPIHFEFVAKLVDGVRQVRKEGAQPTLCQCSVCITRPEIQERARLFDVIGVGQKRATALCEAGVISLKHLIEADPYDLVSRLRMRGLGPSLIRAWQHHAQAMETGQHVRFGHGRFRCPDSFLTLDLEYISGEDIWLFGVQIETPGHSEVIQLWADRKTERKKALKEILTLMKDTPGTPVITWNGGVADIPNLRRAAESCGIMELVPLLEDRHLDLYRFVERNFRFPSTALGLKSVADYFEIPRESPILDGFQAQFLYADYRTTKDPTEKARLREELLAYNRDDLASLRQVITRISELCLAP